MREVAGRPNGEEAGEEEGRLPKEEGVASLERPIAANNALSAGRVRFGGQHDLGAGPSVRRAHFCMRQCSNCHGPLNHGHRVSISSLRKRLAKAAPEWLAHSLGDNHVPHRFRHAQAGRGASGHPGAFDDPGHAKPRGCVQAPDAVREELYRLYLPSGKVNVVDLGSIHPGHTAKDTQHALAESILAPSSSGGTSSPW